MAKALLIITLFFTVSLCLLADENYLVKRGDILIKILRKKFPKQALYGSQGLLKKVIETNSGMKNPNLIFPGQKLNLSFAQKSTSLMTAAQEVDLAPDQPQQLEIQSKLGAEALSSIATEDKMMYLSILYGADISSFSQRQSLGSSDVGVIVPHRLDFIAGFNYKQFDVWAEFETSKINFRTENFSSNQRLNEFSLGLNYSFFITKLKFMDIALLKNNVTRVDVTKETISLIEMGFLKKWKIETRKSTKLNLQALVGVPLTSKPSDSTIKSSNIKGYSLSASLSLQREIHRSSQHDLDSLFEINLSHQNLNRNVTWGTVAGPVKSTQTTISALLGLSITW